MHTTKCSITIIKEASSREGTVILVSNKYIVSTLTIWNSGSRMNEKLENGYGL